MSDVNKQFAKWWDTERLSNAFDSFRQVAREAFLAGHAAFQKELQAEREAYQQHCDNRILRNRIQ